MAEAQLVFKCIGKFPALPWTSILVAFNVISFVPWANASPIWILLPFNTISSASKISWLFALIPTLLLVELTWISPPCDINCSF